MWEPSRELVQEVLGKDMDFYIPLLKRWRTVCSKIAGEMLEPEIVVLNPSLVVYACPALNIRVVFESENNNFYYVIGERRQYVNDLKNGRELWVLVAENFIVDKWEKETP
jgi:hypothetical protein